MPFGGEAGRDAAVLGGSQDAAESPMPFGGEAGRDDRSISHNEISRATSPMPFGGEAGRDYEDGTIRDCAAVVTNAFRRGGWEGCVGP